MIRPALALMLSAAPLAAHGVDDTPRIAVMSAGRVQQVGTPREIYDHPATDFVAGFVGTLNRFPAEVVDGAAGHLRVAGVDVRLDHAVPSGPLTLAARPEGLVLGDSGIPAEVAVSTHVVFKAK